MKKLSAAATLAASAMLAGCATFVGHELVSGDAPVGEIAIQNNSNVPLNSITISRCSAMSHGLNRISSPVQPGRGIRFRVDEGCWDVMVGHGYGTGYDYATFSDVRVVGGRRQQVTVGGRGTGGY